MTRNTQVQSQKTKGFRVADFATLSDERRSRSKIFLLFNMDKRTLGSKILGISQTKRSRCFSSCVFLANNIVRNEFH